MFCYSKIIYDTAFTWVKSTKQLKPRANTKSILDIRLYPVLFSVGNSENTKDIGTQETEQRSYVSFRWEISNFNILLSNWCMNGKKFGVDFFGLWKFSCARSDRVDQLFYQDHLLHGITICVIQHTTLFFCICLPLMLLTQAHHRQHILLHQTLMEKVIQVHANSWNLWHNALFFEIQQFTWLEWQTNA